MEGGGTTDCFPSVGAEPLYGWVYPTVPPCWLTSHNVLCPLFSHGRGGGYPWVGDEYENNFRGGGINRLPRAGGTWIVNLGHRT